jgi:hypothetical protein
LISNNKSINIVAWTHSIKETCAGKQWRNEWVRTGNMPLGSPDTQDDTASIREATSNQQCKNHASDFFWTPSTFWSMQLAFHSGDRRSRNN